MPYIVIEKWLGLDSRRDVQASQPGTLVTLENAHLNQGAEIERRKAYGLRYTLVGYGFEVTSSGIVVFGSAALPAGWNAYVSTNLTASFDTAYSPPRSYLRLTHPTDSSRTMAEVVSSCVYNNIPFVIARFTKVATSDDTIAFYNGIALSDQFLGIVKDDGSAHEQASIATYLAQSTNLLPTSFGYSATNDIANPTSTVTVTGPSGFTISFYKNSVNGTMATATTSPTVKTLAVGGTWVTGDVFGMILTNSGIAVTVGAGFFGTSTMTFCYTYGNRVYVLAGSRMSFSGIGTPAVFNDYAGIGASWIDMANTIGSPENLVSMTHYQGKLAIFSRNSIQIWHPDADPKAFQQLQVLENTGTISKLAVQPLGDLDVFYTADSGARSLRVRDVSSNAYLNDLGVSIDSILQPFLNTCTATELTQICAIVEPKSNRLWIFVPNAAGGVSGVGDRMYVLSYFPTSKIIAWSVYKATYQGALKAQTYFQPQKFQVYKGTVFCRATVPGGTDSLIAYDYIVGDETYINRSTGYDDCVATVETPWLDAKTPATLKQTLGIDITRKGGWTISASTDPTSSTLTPIALVQGGISLADIAELVKYALNAADGVVYTVIVQGSTFVITAANAFTFAILTSGSVAGTFTYDNNTSLTSHTVTVGGTWLSNDTFIVMLTRTSNGATVTTGTFNVRQFSFEFGRIPWETHGVRFKLKAVSTEGSESKLSNLILHYNPMEAT